MRDESKNNQIVPSRKRNLITRSQGMARRGLELSAKIGKRIEIERDVRHLKTFKLHSGWVDPLRVSSDGKYVVSGSGDCTICKWEISSGEVLCRLQESLSVHDVDISPDSHYAISACMDIDGDEDGYSVEQVAVSLWDLESGRKVRTFQEFSPPDDTGYSGNPQPGNSRVILSPDVRYAIFRDEESLSLWNVVTGRKEITWREPAMLYDPSILRYSPDGKYVIAALGMRIILFESNQPVSFINMPMWIEDVNFAQDENHINCTGAYYNYDPSGEKFESWSARLYKFNINEMENINIINDRSRCFRHLTKPYKSQIFREKISEMILSHDGRYTIIITEESREEKIQPNQYGGRWHYYMHVYDSSDGWNQVFSQEIEYPTSLSISPDNRIALVGNRDGSVDIYSLPN